MDTDKMNDVSFEIHDNDIRMNSPYVWSLCLPKTSILHFPKWLEARIDDISKIFHVHVCCSSWSWRNLETAEFDRHWKVSPVVDRRPNFHESYSSAYQARFCWLVAGSGTIPIRSQIRSLRFPQDTFATFFRVFLLASFPVTKVKEMSTKNTNFAMLLLSSWILFHGIRQ